MNESDEGAKERDRKRVVSEDEDWALELEEGAGRAGLVVSLGERDPESEAGTSRVL